MSKNKMRVSLSQTGTDITGVVESHGDGLFMLECLTVIVESLARKVGVPPAEVARDLYAIIDGRVTKP